MLWAVVVGGLTAAPPASAQFTIGTDQGAYSAKPGQTVKIGVQINNAPSLAIGTLRLEFVPRVNAGLPVPTIAAKSSVVLGTLFNPSGAATGDDTTSTTWDTNVSSVSGTFPNDPATDVALGAQSRNLAGSLTGSGTFVIVTVQVPACTVPVGTVYDLNLSGINFSDSQPKTAKPTNNDAATNTGAKKSNQVSNVATLTVTDPGFAINPASANVLVGSSTPLTVTGTIAAPVWSLLPTGVGSLSAASGPTVNYLAPNAVPADPVVTACVQDGAGGPSNTATLTIQDLNISVADGDTDNTLRTNETLTVAATTNDPNGATFEVVDSTGANVRNDIGTVTPVQGSTTQAVFTPNAGFNFAGNPQFAIRATSVNPAHKTALSEVFTLRPAIVVTAAADPTTASPANSFAGGKLRQNATVAILGNVNADAINTGNGESSAVAFSIVSGPGTVTAGANSATFTSATPGITVIRVTSVQSQTENPNNLPNPPASTDVTITTIPPAQVALTTPPPTNPNTPGVGSATVAQGTTFQIAAAAQDTLNASVPLTYTLSSGPGSVSPSGVYAAPATVAAGGETAVVQITGTDADGAITPGTVTFNLVPVSIDVKPDTGALALGESLNMTATIVGATQDFEILVNGVTNGNATVGTITNVVIAGNNQSATFTYNSPASLPTPNPVQVQVRQASNTPIGDTTPVTLRDIEAVITEASGKTEVRFGKTADFDSLVQEVGAGGRDLSSTFTPAFSITAGSSAATINATTGVLTPTNVTQDTTVTVKVTETENGRPDVTRSATKDIIVRPAIAVTLNPTNPTVSVDAATALTLTAAVTGIDTTAPRNESPNVTFSIVSGTGTVTVDPNDANKVTFNPNNATGPTVVKATSNQSTTEGDTPAASATTTVTVIPAAAVTINAPNGLSNGSTIIGGGADIDFDATVSNVSPGSDTGVTWSVAAAAGSPAITATIDANGLLHTDRPAQDTDIVITATSKFDPRKTATLQLHVLASATNLTVVGDKNHDSNGDFFLRVGNSLAIQALPVGVTDLSKVTFTTDPAETGTFSTPAFDAGSSLTSVTYTAPATVPAGGTVKIIATNELGVQGTLVLDLLPELTITLNPANPVIRANNPGIQIGATVNGIEPLISGQSENPNVNFTIVSGPGSLGGGSSNVASTTFIPPTSLSVPATTIIKATSIASTDDGDPAVSTTTAVTILPEPVIISISPSSSVSAGLITLRGRNFGDVQGNSTVTLNGVVLSVLTYTNTEIVARQNGDISGSVVVTSLGGRSNPASFNILPRLASLTIAPANPTVGVGERLQFSVTGVDVNGNAVSSGDLSDVAWSVNGGGDITTTGRFFAIQTGQFTITARSRDMTATTSVTVVIKPVISSLAPGAVLVGDTLIIAGNGFGDVQGDGTVSLNNVPVAQANILKWSEGVIQVKVPVGVTDGPVVVTKGGFSSNNNVILKTIHSLAFSPDTMTIQSGLTRQLNVVALTAQGDKIQHDGVQYTVTDGTGDGTVSEDGLFTANKVGDVTVTATLDGFTATATITVTEAPTVGASPTSPVFTQSEQTTIGDKPTPGSIISVNLFGDPTPEIVTANGTAGSITVLFRGTGDQAGTFTSSFDVPFEPNSDIRSVDSGDFNDDGLNDLVVADFGTDSIRILFNDGNQGFTAGPVLPIDSKPNGVVVADFNGDGLDDVAATDFTEGKIAVFLRHSERPIVFSPADAHIIGTGPIIEPNGLETLDVNGDGKADLLVTTQGNGLYEFLNDGTGVFSTSQQLTQVASPDEIDTGDVNNDGKVDLIVLDTTDKQIGVFLSNGQGSYPDAYIIPTNGNVDDIAVGDFNNDGNLDIALSDKVANTIGFLLGQGNGRFTPSSNFVTGTSGQLLATDLNGDNKEDLVVGSNTPGQVDAVLNATTPGGSTVKLGDVIADGVINIRDVTLALNAVVGSVQLTPDQLKAADLNKNGKVDIADVTLLLRVAIGITTLPGG